ncbi:MAG: DUF3800 domain-containing protein [Cellulomonadaceae bacterium]|jgi:hypothetical protein|nr:DUF3800 domain-containing protein [Cellulomonadaceae bacterium]
MQSILDGMLLAYIDEIGEPGAFVARDHAKFRTSPAFGYAGFVIPESSARLFAQDMAEMKRNVFASALQSVANPGQWERKGATIFHRNTRSKHPEQIRAFSRLVSLLVRRGGRLFYYADEKVPGTPKQVLINPADRETAAMRETLNRLSRHADTRNQNLLVLIDQINEKTRAERLPNMYGHILGRAAGFPEMSRIIEPPMHVDSVLSANIQFADWVAAAVTRAIDFQIFDDSEFGWIAAGSTGRAVRGHFTFESKLHLSQRSIADLHNDDIFATRRPIHPRVNGHSVGSGLDPAVIRRIKAAADKAQR